MQTSNTFVQTPVTELSSLIALIAIVAWLYGFYKVYSNYRQNQKKQSFYFSMGLLFGGLAIVFLALELLTLQIFDAGTQAGQEYVGKTVAFGLNSYQLGAGFSYVAVVLSIIAIFSFDTFSMSFFENKMKFLIIPAILLIAYFIIYFFPNPIIKLNSTGTDYNPSHPGNIDTLIVAVFLIPLFFPALIFLLTAIQTRANTYASRRSLALCFLQILLGIGYTIEIVGGVDFLSVIGRLFILIYPFLTWNVLQGSNFVRKILGSPS